MGRFLAWKNLDPNSFIADLAKQIRSDMSSVLSRTQEGAFKDLPLRKNIDIFGDVAKESGLLELPDLCDWCDAELSNPLRCSKCRTARYCSKDCQIKACDLQCATSRDQTSSRGLR